MTLIEDTTLCCLTSRGGLCKGGVNALSVVMTVISSIRYLYCVGGRRFLIYLGIYRSECRFSAIFCDVLHCTVICHNSAVL